MLLQPLGKVRTSFSEFPTQALVSSDAKIDAIYITLLPSDLASVVIYCLQA